MRGELSEWVQGFLNGLAVLGPARSELAHHREFLLALEQRPQRIDRLSDRLRRLRDLAFVLAVVARVGGAAVPDLEVAHHQRRLFQLGHMAGTGQPLPAELSGA